LFRVLQQDIKKYGLLLSRFNLFQFNPERFISIYKRYKELAKNQVKMGSQDRIGVDTPVGAGLYVTFHMRPVQAVYPVLNAGSAFDGCNKNQVLTVAGKQILHFGPVRRFLQVDKGGERVICQCLDMRFGHVYILVAGHQQAGLCFGRRYIAQVPVIALGYQVIAVSFYQLRQVY